MDEETSDQQELVVFDFNDEDAVAGLGRSAQRDLSRLTEKMLDVVSVSPVDLVSHALNAMLEALDQGRMERSSRRSGGLARMFSRFFGADRRAVSELRRHIDVLAAELERHKTAIMTSIVKLERLDKQVEQVHEDLKQATQALANAPQHRIVMARREDLLLSLAVAQQNLPSIRTALHNEQMLLAKIDTVLRVALPAWHQNAATAVRRPDAHPSAANDALLLAVEEGKALADQTRDAQREARAQRQSAVTNTGS